MAFPGDLVLNRKNVPQHASIDKCNDKRYGNQSIVLGKDPFKENKTGQEVNYTTGTNVI